MEFNEIKRGGVGKNMKGREREREREGGAGEESGNENVTRGVFKMVDVLIFFLNFVHLNFFSSLTRTSLNFTIICSLFHNSVGEKVLTKIQNQCFRNSRHT